MHAITFYTNQKESIKMEEYLISNECFKSTGFSYTLSLINGKYKMTILYVLAEFGTVRFNELKRYIEKISYKTLSSTLKELEADQLVHRKEYPQIPPKVEYSLTERGKSLIPILNAICDWGEENRL
jgi:DNA-binding HxlR family transcriptional regulator